MKILTVPFLELRNSGQDMLPMQSIDQKPLSTNQPCKAEFSIFHFNKGLCIKYAVVEPFLNVKKRRINEAVNKDNCVEFFMAFDNEEGYYNFEFNCLGSIKAAFGESRHHRKFLSPILLKQVQDNLEIMLHNNEEGNRITWELTVILPVSVFQYHNKESLSGVTCTGNFTKCGDDLPNPHFLSWVNLPSVSPDFHQPSFFGKIIFKSNDSDV
jgi:hypothetical protein